MSPPSSGLGVACELATAELDSRYRHLAELRDLFEAEASKFDGASVHGVSGPRLPHTSHVAFAGVSGEALVMRLDLAGFAVSTGAACASGVAEPSRTTVAMGLEPEEALASIRVSFGMPNSRAEVEAFVPVLHREVEALREHAEAVRDRQSASREHATGRPS